MTDQLYAARGPRFNHVAMSVPSSLLDDANRADIDRFWGDVFGFHEIFHTLTVVAFLCHWSGILLVALDPPFGG